MLSDVSGCQTLSFGGKALGSKKARSRGRLIIMDEVDGMSSGDIGGLQLLGRVIKEAKVPIIAICNDKDSQKMNTFNKSMFTVEFKVREEKRGEEEQHAVCFVLCCCVLCAVCCVLCGTAC